MANPLDLSKFKKVRTEKDHTVLQHPHGHEIKVVHKMLSPKVKEQLDALPHAAYGMYTGLKEENKESNFKAADVRGNNIVSSQIHKYAEGGNVKLQQADKANPTPAPQQPSDWTVQGESAPTGAEQMQQSMRKAFHFDQGGTPAPIDPQKAQDVQASMRKAFHFESGGKFDDRGPDTSHQSLSKAIENLSQRYSPQFNMTAPENIAQGEASPTEPPIPPPTTAPAQESPLTQTAPQQVQDVGAPQGSLIQQANQNTNVANQAEMAAAKNTQQAQEQNAQTYGKQTEDLQKVQQHYEELGNDLHSKFDNTANEVAQGKIDPHNWWNSKSTGSKILTAIGMLFAGAGAGVSGHPEMVGNIINSAIDRDIQSQKDNLNNKNTLLSKYLEMYHDMPQAEQATRLTLGAVTEGLINQQAAKLGSQNAINAATMANAQRRQALLPQMEGLARGQMMMKMYGDQGKGGQGQQAAGNEEQLVQNQIQDLRDKAIISPHFAQMAKDLENKYLPGIGMAVKEIPEKVTSQLSAAKDLSQQMARLELFAKQHQGTVMDRAVVNEGKVLAANAQSALRVAQDQGVFKPSDQHFIESMISSDPTAFFADTRTLPKYRTIHKLNEATMNTLMKSYGVKPFKGQGESGNQNQSAIQWLKDNPNDPLAPQVRKKLGL